MRLLAVGRDLEHEQLLAAREAGAGDGADAALVWLGGRERFQTGHLNG
jgi:hypothetical protein